MGSINGIKADADKVEQAKKLAEQVVDDLEDCIFDDVGGASANNNLRVVSEEDLKNNKNALEDKK